MSKIVERIVARLLGETDQATATAGDLAFSARQGGEPDEEPLLGEHSVRRLLHDEDEEEILYDCDFSDAVAEAHGHKPGGG